MQFIALGNLHRGTQQLLDPFGKARAGIAAVRQHVDHCRQGLPVPAKHRQRTGTIGYLGRRHMNRMRQALRVHRNMALDARDLLAGVIPLGLRRVGILDALRVDDAKRRLAGATSGNTYVADHIFLKRSPAGSIRRSPARCSIAGSTHGRCATVENRPAITARYTRS